MCFSATVSLGSSIMLAALGIATLKSAKSRAIIPFALIPLFFALQQASEGFLWFALEHGISWLAAPSMYTFLFFALLIWPLWIPFSLMRVEKGIRKIILGILEAAGICFALLILAPYLLAQAHIGHGHICYTLPTLSYSTTAQLLYGLTTIVPFFVASYPLFWGFGTAVAGALALSYWFFYAFTISVWCFFAALLSAFILLIVRQHPRPPVTPFSS